MDVAFALDRNGKLDFARNAEGDFYLDDLAVYAVVATLSAHKGAYGWDGTVGTYLHTIKKDGAVTGTRLRSAMADAAAQLVADGTIRSMTGTADRLRVGAWSLTPNWKPIYGQPQKETLRL